MNVILVVCLSLVHAGVTFSLDQGNLESHVQRGTWRGTVRHMARHGKAQWVIPRHIKACTGWLEAQESLALSAQCNAAHDCIGQADGGEGGIPILPYIGCIGMGT